MSKCMHCGGEHRAVFPEWITAAEPEWDCGEGIPARWAALSVGKVEIQCWQELTAPGTVSTDYTVRFPDPDIWSDDFRDARAVSFARQVAADAMRAADLIEAHL